MLSTLVSFHPVLVFWLYCVPFRRATRIEDYKLRPQDQLKTQNTPPVRRGEYYKKNLNASRAPEHPPVVVRGKNVLMYLWSVSINVVLISINEG